jgi:hypothetical protein
VHVRCGLHRESSYLHVLIVNAADGASPCNPGLEDVDSVCKRPCGGDGERPCPHNPSPEDCGEWKSKKEVSSDPFMEINIKDRRWCWQKCRDLPGCDGVTWNSKAEKNCQLHKLGSEDKLKKGSDHSQAFLLCKDCGSWEPAITLSGSDLSTTTSDSHGCARKHLCTATQGTVNNACNSDHKYTICRCAHACMSDERCNAVVWEKETWKCMLKSLDVGYKRENQPKVYSYVFCNGVFPAIL